MTRKNILKMVSAVLIFVIVFAILTAVMEPKWNYYGNQTQTRVQAFYRQEKNSHDVIYLGSSFSYCGISPLKIWEDQGITGYVFSNPDQKAWMSAYYLEEALKYQTPKVVMYECGAILEEQDTDEGHNRKNIDYLRWSLTKLKAISDICSHTGESEKEYLFPLLRFHSRWSDLDQTDFHLAWDSSYYLMGTALKMTTRPASSKKISEYADWASFPAQKNTPDSVGPRADEAIQKIKQMCDEKGITFQLVRMPSMQWSPKAHEIVNTYAQTHDIPFLDLNLYQDEVGIDWKTDTHDKGNHLNIRGCEKASAFLGKYLNETYEFDTQQSRENEKFWNDSAEKFQSLLDSYELPLINDCAEYTQAVRKKDFVTAVTMCGTSEESLTAEQKEAFCELGIQLPETDGSESNAYYALLDGTEPVEQQSGKGVLKSKPYTWEEDTFTIICSDFSGEEETVIQVNDETFEVNRPGINFVVYDKTLKNVVDVVCFDTTKPGVPAEHVEQTVLEDDGGE